MYDLKLGERNPDTLPNGTRANESFDENETESRRWRVLRKLAANGTLIGMKY